TRAATYLQTFVQNQPDTAQAGAKGQNNNPNTAMAILGPLVGFNTNEVDQPDLATTFHPGTTDRSKAISITVESGSEVRGADVTLVQERTFRVRGRVFDSRKRQQPLQAVVQMASKQTLGMATPRNGNYEVSTGTFEFRDVPPGEYIIVAVAQSVVDPTGVAQAEVNVSKNVDDLVLTVRSGFAIKGQITLEGTKPLSTLPELSHMKVGLLASSDALVNAGQPAPIKADGTFTLENVSPGEYRVAIASLPPNAYVKQARFGETNLLEDNASITASTTESIEISVSRDGGQITGKLIDMNSKPVASTQVVLAPDRQRDRRELFKAQATDQTGKFTFQANT